MYLTTALTILIPVLVLQTPTDAAQDIPFPAPANEKALESATPALARAILAAKPADPEIEFRARIAAGDYAAADAILHALNTSRANNPSPVVRARDLPYEMYARARLISAGTSESLLQAYEQGFRDRMTALDNATAAVLVNDFSFDNLSRAKRSLSDDFARWKGNASISARNAEALIRDRVDLEMYGAIATGTSARLTDDDTRRYEISKDVTVKTPDGSIICTLVVRPRNLVKRPALLEFTIYNDADSILREARRAASNDYVGVVGLTRGKGCSEGPVVPYEHDGADADVLIDWIAKQPWSDGRVGMYGGSYSGFTAWAAAKHPPSALKAIMVG